MNEVEIYPPEILALHNTAGYLEYFYNASRNTTTDRDAWEQTENTFKSYFGISKYSTYESFKVVKCRFYSRK